jgi:hypothetical protein
MLGTLGLRTVGRGGRKITEGETRWSAFAVNLDLRGHRRETPRITEER